jgi:undecaprenyl-diphosphatase
MGLVEIIILAIVQGLTEFLPVSSSGHLVVANALLEAMGRPPTANLLEVNIALHVGTLVSILIFYWRQLLALLTDDRRVIGLLVVGTIPAVVVGIPLKELAPQVLQDPLVAGVSFAVTALMLLSASRLPEGFTPYRDLSYAGALRIGLWQSIALLPGISRSGATISAGLRERLDRQSAGTFAFLLAVPAIGGAGLLEVIELARQSGDAITGRTPPGTLLIGGIVSAIVGFLALSWLIRWIQKGRLSLFAWYLIPLSIVVVLWRILS